jgi:transglutaminase/protease-like cytokinesis protein 3
VDDDDTLSGFVKTYNEFYFLTDPSKLITNHYPDDTKWALLTNVPSKQQFYSWPYFHTDFYTANIKYYSPTDGTIQLTSIRKTVHIELETEDLKKSLVISEYPDLAPAKTATSNKTITEDYAPKHKIIGNKIILDYELQSVDTKRIDVYYNNKTIISYGIWMFK